ncbi:MAG: zinc metalloprotease HtpX [Chloroflexi bacterium]|nr:zinc metalloprotease HtpX [Chloroflexota bacterium]
MGSNTIKTTLLLGGLTGLFMVIGGALAGSGGLIIALILATALNMGAWWFSGSLALRMSGAQEVSAEEAPDLHNMVESLANNAQMPKPRVYIIETDMPNAFATGRNPQNGAVAVTSGIMGLLNRDELAGVVAHELAHIKHYDTLISSIAATIGGAITFIAEMAFWSMLFGGGDDEEGGGGGFLMLFLAPIAATIIQMAVSRSREFSADAGGARILGDPLPLASALSKLETWSQSMQGGMLGGRRGQQRQPQQAAVNPATAHLYIVPPALGGLGDLFRTHPRTEDRIARLQELARSEGRPVAVR